MNKKNNILSVNRLCSSYCLFGCLGGAALGFLSLGLPGLAIGLVGGLVIGALVRKGVAKIT